MPLVQTERDLLAGMAVLEPLLPFLVCHLHTLVVAEAEPLADQAELVDQVLVALEVPWPLEVPQQLTRVAGVEADLASVQITLAAQAVQVS